MKKAKLSKVSTKTSESGVKYLRLEYQLLSSSSKKVDGADDELMKLFDQVEEGTSKPLVDVMSAGKFLDDGSPDKQAAEEWVDKMKPVFTAIGKKGFIFDVETQEVPVSPYYKIRKGVVDTNTVYKTISIDCVLNPKTGLPWINNAFQSKADSRLTNGTSMYITVEAYKKRASQQDEADIEGLDELTKGLEGAADNSDEETF